MYDVSSTQQEKTMGKIVGKGHELFIEKSFNK